MLLHDPILHVLGSSDIIQSVDKDNRHATAKYANSCKLSPWNYPHQHQCLLDQEIDKSTLFSFMGLSAQFMMSRPDHSLPTIHSVLSDQSVQVQEILMEKQYLY